MDRIVVLTGGSTPERTVALAGAAQVVASLRRQGFDVRVADTVGGLLDRTAEADRLGTEVGGHPPSPAELDELRRREDLEALLSAPEISACDVLVPVLHGDQGEGGEVQRLLERRSICFAGSDARGSERAMDKDRTKQLLVRAGVPTPRWAMWPADTEEVAALGAPLLVKPSRVGSTVGVSLVEDPGDPGCVEAAARHALEFDRDVLLEEFLPGRELTVGILGEQVLGVGEIVVRGRVFDFESKYTPGVVSEVFPADLDHDLHEEVRRLARVVHDTLGLRDFSRVDFRLDRDGEPSCLEVNTLPGMTVTSLLPQSALCVGIDFDRLCRTLVELALARRDDTDQGRAVPPSTA